MRRRYMMVRLPVCLYKVLKARASEAGVKPRSLAAAYLAALLGIIERKKRKTEGNDEED